MVSLGSTLRGYRERVLGGNSRGRRHGQDGGLRVIVLRAIGSFARYTFIIIDCQYALGKRTIHNKNLADATERLRLRDLPQAANDSDSEYDYPPEPRDARRRGHINRTGGRRTLPQASRSNRLDDPCGAEHDTASNGERVAGKRRRFFKATGLQTGLKGLEWIATPIGADGGRVGDTRSWLAGLGTHGNGNNGHTNTQTNTHQGAGPAGRSAMSGVGNATVLEWAGGGVSRAASPMSVV